MERSGMKVTALVMAGGSGERMRRSNGDVPKPLVKVLGVPLIERNLFSLFRGGIRDIVVSVPPVPNEVAGFIDSHCRKLVEVVGANISTLVEETPLGNMGCAGRLRDISSTTLVVYSDNLTTLDLCGIIEAHEAASAAMTIATHLEPFHLPYGEVEAIGSRVVGYREKPIRRVNVCSAVSVLGPKALRALPEGRPTGISELVNLLIQKGELVLTFPHAAPWIDVNDRTAIAKAEALVVRHFTDFEQWAPAPSVEAVCVVVHTQEAVLLERHDIGCCETGRKWSLPLATIATGHTPPAAALHAISEGLGLTPIECRFFGTLDEFDVGSGVIRRIHVFRGRVGASTAAPRSMHEVSWWDRTQIPEQASLTVTAVRCLAALSQTAG
jgi:NDP-mannose synthase